jgi:hypothetical protein
VLRVTKEPLEAIRALATIEVETKKVLAEMVVEARKTDHTWAQIAEALGTTRQGRRRDSEEATMSTRPATPDDHSPGASRTLLVR